MKNIFLQTTRKYYLYRKLAYDDYPGSLILQIPKYLLIKFVLQLLFRKLVFGVLRAFNKWLPNFSTRIFTMWKLLMCQQQLEESTMLLIYIIPVLDDLWNRSMFRSPGVNSGFSPQNLHEHHLSIRSGQFWVNRFPIFKLSSYCCSSLCWKKSELAS